MFEFANNSLHHDVSFVVDLHLLDDFNDIKADASGIGKGRDHQLLTLVFIRILKRYLEDQKWET